MKTEQFGIFGGTFAPPHLGHFLAASAFLTQCPLDTLHLIPTGTPPHKPTVNGVSAQDRLEMLRLGAAEILCDPRVVIDDYEITQAGKSYTYLTLQHYTKPNRALWFLCGTDMFLSLDTWKHPEIIFSLAHIVYLQRETQNADLTKTLQEKTAFYQTHFSARITRLEAEPLEISSSQLRKGKNFDAYLPKSVQQYITDHRLFSEEGSQ